MIFVLCAVGVGVTKRSIGILKITKEKQIKEFITAPTMIKFLFIHFSRE
jgi:hypothetical protein